MVQEIGYSVAKESYLRTKTQDITAQLGTAYIFIKVTHIGRMVFHYHDFEWRQK